MIIDTDFLRHFGQMIDMRKRMLVDTVTELCVQGILSSYPSPSSFTFLRESDNPYLDLLTEFPALSRASSPESPVKHNVIHYIETTSPPVSA